MTVDYRLKGERLETLAFVINVVFYARLNDVVIQYVERETVRSRVLNNTDIEFLEARGF